MVPNVIQGLLVYVAYLVHDLVTIMLLFMFSSWLLLEQKLNIFDRSWLSIGRLVYPLFSPCVVCMYFVFNKLLLVNFPYHFKRGK